MIITFLYYDWESSIYFGQFWKWSIWAGHQWYPVETQWSSVTDVSLSNCEGRWSRMGHLLNDFQIYPDNSTHEDFQFPVKECKVSTWVSIHNLFYVSTVGAVFKSALQLNPRCNIVRSKIEILAIESALQYSPQP